VFFDVTDEEILDRLEKRRSTEGRADDDPEAVKTRLEAYRRQTAPVLAWYQQRQTVHHVPGVGAVDEIFDHLCQAVGC